MSITSYTTTRPSPTLSFIGRKNSGKTTLLVKLIEELTSRGVDVATLKHHGHPEFEIDVPGKDSYRHRHAGANASAVLSSKTFAYIEDTPSPMSAHTALSYLTNHDIVLMEGFRNEGQAAVEILRAENPRDVQAAEGFIRSLHNQDNPAYMPVAAVTNIPEVIEACNEVNLPQFGLEDIEELATFVINRFVRGKLTIAIQAGGESKRMGQSKALVPFLGKPLISHMVSTLSPIADELIITTNEPEKLEFLKENHPEVMLIRDEFEQRGSLPGFISALKNATSKHIAIVACDMVNASPELITNELHLLQRIQTDAIIPATKHGIEPFSGVYLTQPLLEAALQTYNDGNLRIKDALAKINATEIYRDNPWKINFPLGCFFNANTPEDITLAEELLGY